MQYISVELSGLYERLREERLETSRALSRRWLPSGSLTERVYVRKCVLELPKMMTVSSKPTPGWITETRRSSDVATRALSIESSNQFQRLGSFFLRGLNPGVMEPILSEIINPIPRKSMFELLVFVAFNVVLILFAVGAIMENRRIHAHQGDYSTSRRTSVSDYGREGDRRPMTRDRRVIVKEHRSA